MFSTAENCMDIKTGGISLIRNYLRPSYNSRQLIFDINAVVLKVIMCYIYENGKMFT